MRPPTLMIIPISKILPHPENPRGAVSPESAQSMAESLKEVGQVTEVRVRPLTEAEKAENPAYEYMLIGGHIRLAGAKLAGMDTLRAMVVDSDPKDDLMDAVLDNRRAEMSWWDWDRGIETLYNLMEEPSQRKLAAQLGWSVAKVNRALRIMAALTPQARAMVGQNLASCAPDEEEGVTTRNTQNKGFLLAESVLLALSDLKEPPKVEEALRQVLEKRMTEPQVRQMVATIKNGGVPLTPKPKPSPRAGEGRVRGAVDGATGPSPLVPVDGKGTQGQPPVSGVGGSGSGASTPSPFVPSDLKGTQGQVPVSGAGETGGVRGDGDSPLQKVYGLFKSHPQATAGLGGLVGGFLASNLKRALGTLVRRYMLHGLAALGILAYLGFHGMGNLFKPKAANSSVPPTAQPQAAPAEPQAVPVKAEASKPSPWKGEGRVRGTSKKAVSAHEKVAAAPSESASIPRWAPEGLPLVKDFAERFYNVSYQSWNSDLAYFKAHMTDDYASTFVKQFYPDSRRLEFQEKQEFQYFSNTKSPQVIGGEGSLANYRVQGQVDIQSRVGRTPQNIGSKPVTLEIAVRHVDGMGYRVEKVTEVDPVAAPKTETTGDPAKAAGSGDPTAKFVGDAAGEAAKKLLGL